MKYVRETAAGRNVSAWVIMKGARHVATIQARYGAAVLVNVFNRGDSDVKSLKAYIRDNGAPKVRDIDGALIDMGTPEGLQRAAAYWNQYGTAGGYGYDKETAAMSGLYVDGLRLSDHCEESKKPPKGLPCFPADYKAPRGWSLANHSRWIRTNKDSPWLALDMGQKGLVRLMGAPAEYREDLAPGELETLERMEGAESRGNMLAGYGSCHKEAGLRFLEARGYRVIRAI